MARTAHRSIRLALVASLLCLGRSSALANEASEQAKQILQQLDSGDQDVLGLSKKLTELDPQPVEFYKEFLQRTRSSSVDERRKALLTIGAQVPDDTGRFTQADVRMTAEQKAAQEDFDWLSELAKVGKKGPAFANAVADTAVIRALAGSKNSKAGEIIFDLSFSAEGIVYRDECGRYLRKMSPYSLPALISRSQLQAKTDREIRRYATYQLERLDRQNPFKALRDAADDRVKIEILQAFADSRFREAIYAVLEVIDDPSPAVRKAARDAWMQYIDAVPHKVPERKLVLTGGKKSEEKAPLWYNHRELQDVAIRRLFQEETKKKPRGSLDDVSLQLFDHYDRVREKALTREMDSALDNAKSGKLAEAIPVFDQILTQTPDHPRRSELAQGYLDFGDSLAGEKKWQAAAAAYGSAYSCAKDKNQELAQEALGKHHEARGELALASGSDATVEFQKAHEVDPVSQAKPTNRRWMLPVGGSAVLLGLVLFAAGMISRRK